jgi:hypothetical protein
LKLGVISLFFYLIAGLSHGEASTTELMYYVPKSNVPSDLGTGLQQLQINSEDRVHTRQRIIILDQLMEQITEQELLMFGKTELYKALFRQPRGLRPRPELFEHGTVQLANRALEEARKQTRTHPFTTFFWEALNNDLKSIIETPQYRTFLTRFRNTPNQLEADDLLIRRRLELILPWLQWYQDGGIGEVNSHLQEALGSAIDALIARINDYLFLTRTTRLALTTDRQGDLSFFRLEARPDLQERSDQTTEVRATLEGALAPLIESVPKLPVPVNDWIPADTVEQFFSPAPDPGYIPPEQMPSPVNDWLETR